MTFSVDQSGPLRPRERLDLNLSLEELMELANLSRDLLHSSSSPWPLGSRFALQVPDHERPSRTEDGRP
jgi:hypothetical protein